LDAFNSRVKTFFIWLPFYFSNFVGWNFTVAAIACCTDNRYFCLQISLLWTIGHFRETYASCLIRSINIFLKVKSTKNFWFFFLVHMFLCTYVVMSNAVYLIKFSKQIFNEQWIFLGIQLYGGSTVTEFLLMRKTTSQTRFASSNLFKK
jgi:hypothetical protein